MLHARRSDLLQARRPCTPGERAAAVKAGAAAEQSEGSLDGREHSSTMSLAGQRNSNDDRNALINPIPAAFSVLTAGEHYRGAR